MLWMMTIVLSSVPYGQGTTLSESNDLVDWLFVGANPSLPSLQRRCTSSHLGLDHHDSHLRLRRHLPRRNRLEVSRLGRVVLLVIPAFSA